MGQPNQIFVGNLAFSLNEKSLQEAFEQFGTIVDVKIPTDRETGKKRGFGFVTFESSESVTKALSMDGKELQGRPLRVNVAQGKKESSGGRR